MARNPRYLPHPGAMVEITQRTIQGLFLMKPCPRFNALAAGCLARAQKQTAATVHAVAILSTHFHLLASFETVEQMAQFMCQFKTNLSKEIGRLYDLSGPKFAGRYKSIPLSDEPEIQERRLEYILSQGAKEGLVLSPRDWPGVHSADALENEEPIRGIWVDRTRLFAARQRGEEVSERDFTTKTSVRLRPLPHLAKLSKPTRQARISAILAKIEAETLEMHRRDQTVPLGVEAILSRHPLSKPVKVARSPKPHFHTTKARFRVLMDGFREFVAAYRAAAERLASGDRRAAFPENCFPPGLPFVQPALV